MRTDSIKPPKSFDKFSENMTKLYFLAPKLGNKYKVIERLTRGLWGRTGSITASTDGVLAIQL